MKELIQQCARDFTSLDEVADAFEQRGVMISSELEMRLLREGNDAANWREASDAIVSFRLAAKYLREIVKLRGEP